MKITTSSLCPCLKCVSLELKFFFQCLYCVSDFFLLKISLHSFLNFNFHACRLAINLTQPTPIAFGGKTPEDKDTWSAYLEVLYG